MDELLQEFLTETGENLDTVDRELVRFEQDPNNAEILRNIFRLVHTVKGTCGFIGLPRLEALTHAAESVIGQFRDGASVSVIAVTAILETIDRLKDILSELADKGQEPAGNDEVLITELRALADSARAQITGRLASGDGDPVAAYLARHAPSIHDKLGEDGLDLIFRSAPGPERGRDGRIEQPAAPAAEDAPRSSLQAAGPPTLRVNVDTIEHLMTMVSELVLTRNQLLDIARKQEDTALKAPLQRLSLITAELQDGVMKTRMQPIGNAWSKLPRIVRDLSTELGKRIELEVDGADTELDRQVLDLIKDPLTHLVRNCADHAIEPAAERRAAGKPEHGTIRLAAYHEGGSVTIVVSDDGRGLDIPRIRRKSVQQGLTTEAELERMDDDQVARLIFHPGFSTSESITAISGRGVGLDVVKVNVDAAGGAVDIASTPGAGTTITIKIPLTLAIVSALIVAAGEQRFAIPQIVVRELVRVRAGSEQRVERINGAPVLRVRDRLLPIVTLGTVLGDEAASQEDGFIVVTQIGGRQFGILVDGVFHTEEIVVKPMSTKLRHIPLFSGNTVMGDGTVVLIVDPNGIARTVGATPACDLHRDAAAAGPALRERTTLLVFRAGGETLQALPLSLVTRLEDVDASLLQSSGGRTLLNYRNRLVPIVTIGETVLRASGLQALVIVSDGDATMALAVEQIVDIVEEVLDVEVPASGDAGVIGSAMIRGRATEILDLAYYLQKADPGWLQPRAEPGTQAAARVILVEPSEFLREMLRPVLKACGREVVLLADIAGAAAASKSRSTQAMLIDVDADPVAAIALASQLRGQCEGGSDAACCLIALTSFVTPEIAGRMQQAGFDATIAKFDRRALLGRLTAPPASDRQAA